MRSLATGSDSTGTDEEIDVQGCMRHMYVLPSLNRNKEIEVQLALQSASEISADTKAYEMILLPSELKSIRI
jgi:hypothetical protein